MTISDKEVLRHVDHTCLRVDATGTMIHRTCLSAITAQAATVCIPPCYVKLAKDTLLNSGTKVCTVIGFPAGYSHTDIKVAEMKQALADGADEIDAVINVCWIKSKRWDDVEQEVKLLSEASGHATFKLIIETALLTEEEIRTMCDICCRYSVDYIKTSTGFSSRGATLEDIRIMKDAIGDRPLKMKASGGISTMDEARKFLLAGADRIGSSRVVSEYISESSDNPKYSKRKD